MEPILDETTLVPAGGSTPAERILRLATLLRDLDQRGAMPVLRSVRDAKDRDVGGLRGLQSWCFAFSEQVDRDAGRLVALRLGKQPFIDGPDGLLARAEGGETIEARVGEQVVYGMAYAVLTDGIAVGLTCAGAVHNAMVGVAVLRADDDDLWSEVVEVLRLVSSEDVEPWRGWIEARTFICSDGLDLCRRASEMFPHLRFGALAREQLSALAGGDPQLLQVLRHLRALDRGAREWLPEVPFSPWGSVRYSDESNATLEHKRLGKLRDFPMPDGFPAIRWRYHTKLAGGFRLYFHAQRADGEGGVVVLVGYVGPHLKTVKFK
jgi:hypothetical protein